LFILLSIKIIETNKDFLNYRGGSKDAVLSFCSHFGFIAILLFLSIYAIWGTAKTIENIKKKRGNAFPVTVTSIKPKNEDAVSYLGTYVIPLLVKGNVGIFEYATFIILFYIYYRLYSASSLILINPLLNIRYGLYEIEYVENKVANDATNKKAMVISQQKWLNEEDELKIIKLSHRLYFAF
jgi:hypothetical protein